MTYIRRIHYIKPPHFLLNLPVPWGIKTPTNTVSWMDPPDSSPQTAAQLPQPFFQNTWLSPMDRRTDKQTNRTNMKLKTGKNRLFILRSNTAKDNYHCNKYCTETQTLLNSILTDRVSTGGNTIVSIYPFYFNFWTKWPFACVWVLWTLALMKLKVKVKVSVQNVVSWISILNLGHFSSSRLKWTSGSHAWLQYE